LAFFAFFCDFLRNYKLSAENRIIKQIEKHKRGGGLTAGAHPSASRPAPLPLLPALQAVAGGAARHRGGGGGLARSRLASGAAWPDRGPGSPAEPAPAAAPGARAQRG